ncbi:hypothetical protein TURU_004275 [Turdus rufiventris]|nr:hypothetical protein TURU_004275 [Turdus rufiventris]
MRPEQACQGSSPPPWHPLQLSFSPSPLDASWVPVYAQETIDFIQAFSSSPDQLQDKDLKLKFLESICTLCRDAKDSGFSQELNDFCCRYKLGEMILVLLKLEPKYEICTQVRRLAMIALAKMRYWPKGS